MTDNYSFRCAVALLRNSIESNSNIHTKNPKLSKLKSVLEEHFETFRVEELSVSARGGGAGAQLGSGGASVSASTRVIVFAQLRSTVQEILAEIRNVKGAVVIVVAKSSAIFKISKLKLK